MWTLRDCPHLGITLFWDYIINFLLQLLQLVHRSSHPQLVLLDFCILSTSCLPCLCARIASLFSNCESDPTCALLIASAVSSFGFLRPFDKLPSVVVWMWTRSNCPCLGIVLPFSTCEAAHSLHFLSLLHTTSNSSSEGQH